jgi:hypothetical protein
MSTTAKGVDYYLASHVYGTFTNAEGVVIIGFSFSLGNEQMH